MDCLSLREATRQKSAAELTETIRTDDANLPAFGQSCSVQRTEAQLLKPLAGIAPRQTRPLVFSVTDGRMTLVLKVQAILPPLSRRLREGGGCRSLRPVR